MRKIFAVFLLILIIMSVMSVPVLASKDSAPTAAVHQTRAELLSQINPEEAESRDYLIEEWYSEIRSIGNGIYRKLMALQYCKAQLNAYIN
jgi:hypothetical protein